MSLAFYKILHLFGVLLLFSALGGISILSMSGATSDRARKLSGMAHGLSLVLILVAGFGLLAKLNLSAAIPMWVWLKMIIWLALGGALVALRRVEKLAAPLFFLLPALGALAAYLAIYKIGG